jgi:heme/copper-type cytochrome/quinol oxidase subunit 2
MNIVSNLLILLGVLIIILFSIIYLLFIYRDKYGPDDIPSTKKLNILLKVYFQHIIITLILAISFIISGIGLQILMK